MTERFTIALVQMAMSADPAENLARALQKIDAAAGDGAQVVCLPELFRSRYFCQREEQKHFELAEPIPGATTAALSTAAKKRGVVILAPLFERRAPGIYHNSMALIDEQGAVAGLYRKMHIPDDPGFSEKYYFAPGDLGFRVFQTRFGAVGPLICWDQWFPEAARLTALAGATILVYPTAIGWLPAEKPALGGAQRDAWRTIQRSHAIANGVFVAAINRVGFEPAGGEGNDSRGDENGIEFWGSSFVCDPFGQVIAEAGTGEEATILAEIDPTKIEMVRRDWPFLRDRRIDAYGGIVERYMGSDEKC